MQIVQALAKNILNAFKKKGYFWAEKKVFWAETVVASNAVSWCRKNGQKAQQLPSKAALQRSFGLWRVLLPKMLLNVLKAGSVAFCGHCRAFYRAVC